MHSGERVTFQFVSSGRCDGFRDEAMCSESLLHLLAAEGAPHHLKKAGGMVQTTVCFPGGALAFAIPI